MHPTMASIHHGRGRFSRKLRVAERAKESSFQNDINIDTDSESTRLVLVVLTHTIYSTLLCARSVSLIP